MKSKDPTETSTTCPKCSKTLSVPSGFQAWCECGWNLDFSAEPPTEYLDQLYQELSHKRGLAKHEAAMASTEAPSPFSSTRLGILLIAALSAVAFLASIAAGYAVIFIFPFNLFTIPLAIGFIGFAWMARPRVPPVPDDLLPESDIPEIRSLVEAISAELGVPPPDGIRIDGDFNAHVGRYGLSQRRILTLGLPLMLSLKGQERVALIAHEMAHFANNDPARGVIFGVTVGSLEGWLEGLYPDEIWPYGDGYNILEKVSVAFGNVFLFALSQIPRAVLWTLAHLHWDDSQQAEYHADLLAARLCSAPPKSSHL